MPEKEQPSGVDLPTVKHNLGDGHTLFLAMTNDVDIFDTLSKRAGEIPPNELRLLYSDKAAWLSENPSQDRQVGYVCANCHKPVVHIEVRSKEKKIIHHRQSCGCSVIFKRGRRFDWLYDTTVSSGNLELKLSKELDLPAEMWRRLRVEKHHERRAALICLLTAAIAARGTATVVGEAAGGWLWLPPWSSWEPWAKEGLQTVLSEMGKTAVLSAPHVSSCHRPFEGTS